MKERTYIAIDLKSFYASVECAERGLDPLTTNLVVADKEYFYHCCITSHFLVFLGFSGFVSLCKFLLSGITWFIFA